MSVQIEGQIVSHDQSNQSPYRLPWVSREVGLPLLGRLKTHTGEKSHNGPHQSNQSLYRVCVLRQVRLPQSDSPTGFIEWVGKPDLDQHRLVVKLKTHTGEKSHNGPHQSNQSPHRLPWVPGYQKEVGLPQSDSLTDFIEWVGKPIQPILVQTPLCIKRDQIHN